MVKVKIVVDSAICLPKELLEEHNIEVVPENFIFQNRAYKDGVDLDPQQLYTLLRQTPEIPTTSAPSPQDFTDAFQRVAKNASSIACILVTGGLSQAGLQAAMIAKSNFSQCPIEILDSRISLGAYGFIVLAAARSASNGKPLLEVIKAAEDMKKRVSLICALDTLKYLAKGGRIGKVAHLMGTLLDVKPIIELSTSTGVLQPIQRVRSRQKALRRLLEIMEERTGTKKPLHVSIDHADVLTDANWLKDQILSSFNCTEIYVNTLAPVIGVHSGPSTIALSFYVDN